MSMRVEDFVPVHLSNTRDGNCVGFRGGLWPEDVTQCGECGEG